MACQTGQSQLHGPDVPLQHLGTAASLITAQHGAYEDLTLRVLFIHFDSNPAPPLTWLKVSVCTGRLPADRT